MIGSHEPIAYVTHHYRLKVYIRNFLSKVKCFFWSIYNLCLIFWPQLHIQPAIVTSGVARQFWARGRTMKLAPLPGLFFSHIPNTSIGILECKFNKMKYFKSNYIVSKN